jgi:ubiquinone/menaquinone biosynthesis C-methylase UbiE
MNKKTWILSGLTVGTAAGVGYVLWKHAQRAVEIPAAMPADRARQLLERAAPLLRLPTSPAQPPEVLPDGSGLRCPVTGKVFPYRDGVLDLLGDGLEKTFTQHTLDTSFTAWVYDRFRGPLTRLLNSPDFPVEVATIRRVLQAQAGDTILDLACGQGNFTVEWAKRVGPEGLVIGLDISRALLTRAAYHVDRWGLDNVLLIRGDAHQLPFASECLHKVNCSGGFHQFPDLPQALREIARVSAEKAVLTASTFAEGPADPRAGVKRWMKRRFDLHFVPLVWLGEQLAALGYTDYEWSLPGGWFGYTSARKVEGSK